MSDKTFEAISTFVTDLADVFQDSHRPLKLFSYFVKQVKEEDKSVVNKLVENFTTFCQDNREAIHDSDSTKFNTNTITYSEKAYVDMTEIFTLADDDTKVVIWQHLLTISALVDPEGNAKQALVMMNNSNPPDQTTNFLNDIFSRVESTTETTGAENPMEAISSIAQSGVFADLVNGMGSGLQNGSLDLSSMMQTVQTMVTDLNNEAKTNGSENDPTLGMINNMMSSLNNINQNPEVE